ncbi:ExeA family protein [Janthinobacterium sp. UMAB-56]|uniref:ExeA family protein n=1 Tax=Janthinobacterium sp. UMAB-56 TaxID=1365361 RepID=UPI00214B881B|nr:AAA family ATPase [Janthinobacterium sp. UMAB-56]
MSTDTAVPLSTPPGRPYAPSPHGMYLRHFGLHTAPFGITPDPVFFYAGNTRGELLAALLYAVTQGDGIIKLTGEVGSGKTMLCRMLAERLPPQVDVVYLLNPRLQPDEVLHAIAAELGLALDGCRADAVLRALHGELIARHAAGRQVLLLAEEAQAMPGATLEALRLLTNLETASHKLLQIVLFGQPELQHTLDLPQFRQLKERITHSFIVPRLPPALLDDYLACRLAAAGRAVPLVFTPAALRQLAHAAQGIVRRVNILADKALLAAFADDAQEISARHVRLAIADSPFYRPPWHAGKSLARALSAVMLLLAAALLWQWLASSQGQTAGAAAIAPPSSQPSNAIPHADARLQAAAPPTLLDSKLAESRDWLARQGPRQLVLQIASLPASQTAAAETFLQQAQQATGLRDIHVFRLPDAAPANRPPAMAPQRSPANTAARLLIVYGSFADRASVEAVWARIAPASPQKILLSDIDSIRTEMKATAAAKTARGAP